METTAILTIMISSSSRLNAISFRGGKTSPDGYAYLENPKRALVPIVFARERNASRNCYSRRTCTFLFEKKGHLETPVSAAPFFRCALFCCCCCYCWSMKTASLGLSPRRSPKRRRGCYKKGRQLRRVLGSPLVLTSKPRIRRAAPPSHEIQSGVCLPASRGV